MSSIFLVWGLFWYWYFPHCFSDFAGSYSFDRGCVWCYGDKSLHWMLSRTPSALWLSQPYQRQNLLPVIEAPRFSSKLRCRVGGALVIPLGKEPLYVLSWKLLMGYATLWCCLWPGVCSPYPQKKKKTVVGIALRSHLHCRSASNCLGHPSGVHVGSQIHQNKNFLKLCPQAHSGSAGNWLRVQP